MSCPQCAADARFEGYRGRTVQTLLGAVRYERAYYHCPHCGHGRFPSDERFRIGQGRSPAAREIVTLAGTLDPFEEGAHRVLRRMAGLTLSASTVRRVTEAVGEDLATRRAGGESFGPQRPWGWHADADGRRVAYVSLDATGVLQQGPHAEKAEGRMPSVAAVFNPPPTTDGRPRERVWQRRYVAGLLSLPEIGRQLRRECHSVGVAQADVALVLTDGGNGLEDCARDALSGIARDIHFVLDFYHAADHVRQFAHALFPHDDEGRRQQTQAWCHTLKHRGGDALLADLQALDLSDRPAALAEAHRLLVGYVRGNQHRMDYPTYTARGWQIGSGLIESACKTVVGQRLKQAGMRWRPPGTTDLCQLRALYKSQPELWQDYWASSA